MTLSTTSHFHTEFENSTTSNFCPCVNDTVPTGASLGVDDATDRYHVSSKLLSRFLQDDKLSRLLQDDKEENEPWKIAVVTITIAVMFYLMITDKIYPDWVMLGGLMIFMITQIITIKEGLAGFSNEGILTVLALFVVADGLSRTGALDYYMGKILGRPTTIAGAQLRLCVPIVIISAFFNNTPIVAMMIPVVLRWSKMIGCPKQQLLMPLSYATILGGTCTLVGTSTNLVLTGLLSDKYPDEPAGNIQLFDVAVYGVPNAIIGVVYMCCFATAILPGGKNKASGGEVTLTTNETDVLFVGARVLPYSPAAGRTVKRSGLNKSAGIYLVNVRRAATGNIHRAVSPDFVVSVGDELYFTGNVEQFSTFCETHGLEILTTDNFEDDAEVTTETGRSPRSKAVGGNDDHVERLWVINRLSDQIGGNLSVEPGPRPTKLVVTRDSYNTNSLILVGIDCADRTGLISDISDALFRRAGLQIKHSEANVIEGRSLSVWRCEVNNGNVEAPQNESLDFETLTDSVWNAVSQVLPDVLDKSSSTVTSNAVQVVRAIITPDSSLIGKTPNTVHIGVGSPYKASIVAYQKSNGKNGGLNTPFENGDLLVLAVKENSSLLKLPPKDFYKTMKKKGSTKTISNDNDVELDTGSVQVWKDLRVLSDDGAADTNESTVPKGEFLTAFTIPPKSPIDGKTLSAVGYSKLPGVVLVSLERPNNARGKDPNATPFTALTPEDTLKVGDILWFTGSAQAIADLQRLHGLAFYQESSTALLQDRRLVQAVVARGSPLVGRTVVDSDFRSVYGGVVLAIQRGSERVHEHPNDVKLQTGDVLLIEADTSFVRNHSRNYKIFALVSEVEDSSPPRPQMFFICLILIFTAFACSAIESIDQSLFVLSAIVGILMAMLGVLTQQEARDAIQWDLFIVVASAFGVSSAMTNSGVAKGLATFLVDAGEALRIGDAGIYGAIYLAVNLLSSILTNNAAAVLAFPIAMEAVDQTGTDRVKMSFIIMLAASDYITSFGYQTNLMVYGPGEYSNMDYLRFGAPMQLLLWFSSVALVSTSNDDTWYVSWIICLIGFVVIMAVRLTSGSVIQYIRRLIRGEANKPSPSEDDTNPTNSSWHFRHDRLKSFLKDIEL